MTVESKQTAENIFDMVQNILHWVNTVHFLLKYGHQQNLFKNVFQIIHYCYISETFILRQ